MRPRRGSLPRRPQRAGVILNVYHNRRRDADILTLAGVLASGELGELWRVHSIMDQDSAATLETGASGGLLRDLGSHLVDQMLWLLGPATHVHGALDWTDRFGEATDCGFFVTTDACVRSRLHGLGQQTQPLHHPGAARLRQQGQLHRLGRRRPGRGPVPRPPPGRGTGHVGHRRRPENWGTLSTQGRPRTALPSAQGNYAGFYTEFARAVRGDGPGPVPAAEGIRTLEVLDAARRSALENAVIAL